MRVQRTRSSPSALREPLTRYTLGGRPERIDRWQGICHTMFGIKEDL